MTAVTFSGLRIASLGYIPVVPVLNIDAICIDLSLDVCVSNVHGICYSFVIHVGEVKSYGTARSSFLYYYNTVTLP